MTIFIRRLKKNIMTVFMRRLKKIMSINGLKAILENKENTLKL